MLAYLLSILTGLGSLAVYLAAFFWPTIHRKSDFFWSGLGLFYALVLWIYAAQETGGLLLGQIAGVALLGWFGWQTLRLRAALDVQETRKQTQHLRDLDRQEAHRPDALPEATQLVADPLVTADALAVAELDPLSDPWESEPAQPPEA